MALENKKLKKNKATIPELIPMEDDSQVQKDKQNASENDVFGRAVTIGLIIAGGVALHKSGILRPVEHGLKQFANNFASSVEANGYYRGHAIRNWANNDTGDILRPINSLFNSKKTQTLGYSIWEDLKTSFSRGEMYSTNTRKIINDTVEDLKILTDMMQKETRGFTDREIEKMREAVQKEMDGQADDLIKQEIEKRAKQIQENAREYIQKRNKSVKTSSLFKNITSIRQANNVIKNASPQAQNKASTVMMTDLIKDMLLTPEMRAAQLKKSGYRSVTLGDIFESFDFESRQLVYKLQRDAAGNIIKDAEGNALKQESVKKILKEIRLDEVVGKDGNTVYDTINKFLSDNTLRIEDPSGQGIPRAVGFFEDVWKNIVIDNRIQIDESGNAINYIMSTTALRGSFNSLRRDFGLPALGFNPVDSFLKFTGIDNIINDKSLSYGIIRGTENFNAFITGKAGRNTDDISTFLSKKFNKPNETFNVLFSKEKAYAVGSEGTFEFIGDGFKAYSIKGADKSFKMPNAVEMLREMGGYDLNKDGARVSRKTFMDITRETLGFGNAPEVGGKAFDFNMSIQEYENMIGRELTKTEKIKYTVGRYLDIGAQELVEHTDNPYIDFGQRSNIDNFFDDILERITHSNAFKTNGFEFEDYQKAIEEVRDKTYERAFGKTFDDIRIGDKIFKQDTIILTKDAYKFSDLLKDVKSKDTNKFVDDLFGFVGQNFSGFDAAGNIGKYYTEGTSRVYNIFNALDKGFSSIGLGLSLDSKRSVGSLVSNLILKRALPVYMLTQIPGMINYFSEPFTTSKEERENGEIDNLGKTLMRDVVKPIDIGAHKISDTVGFTSMMKYLQEMIPGSDHFNELPIIYQLGLGQTEKERIEYIENGYDPIRKNRYWSVSNTPFTGSKIDHWRPNIYRRVEADVKYSDVKYGSRQEYYNNTWYPNLVNPFAPINHFILDQNHWDKKHYQDRPYLITAPKGENIPLIGPLVSGTIGSIYRHKMHKEYWNKDGTPKQVNPEDEKPSQLLKTGVSNIKPKTNIFNDIKNVIDRAFYDTETFNNIQNKTQESYRKAEGFRFRDLFTAKKIIETKQVEPHREYTFSRYKKEQEGKSVNYVDIPSNKFTVTYNPNSPENPYIVPVLPVLPFSTAKEYNSPLQTSSLPYRDYNRYDTALDVYITPSGQVNIVDVPENLNLYKVNEEIKHYSLNKIYGTNQRINLEDYNRGGYAQEEQRPITPHLLYSIGKEFNDISDVYGLRGYIMQSTFTGEANTRAVKIDDSSYTYSANRSFWDANLGGLGGELSEIARRFIPKKDNSIEYLNPIRNTMPTWLPGSNYFVDYLHGDPYSKIMNGEERLPGEGYERINRIKVSMMINANMLGDSRATHVKHFLHQDENTTYAQDEERKQLNKSTTILRSEAEAEKYELGNYNWLEEGADRVVNIFRDDGKGTVRGDDWTNNIVKDRWTSIWHGDKILLAHNYKFVDTQNGIQGQVDAVIKDFHSKTGQSLINFRGVSEEEYNRLKGGHDVRNKDYYEMNYDLYATNNTQSRGYIYYFNQENPDEIYKARIKFNKRDLRSSIENLNASRQDIALGIERGEISRGDLYSLIDRYRILADTAPYSQEFKDISSQISHANLTAKQKREVSAIRERMQEQKEPLRVYDYKFKTSNLKSEKVTVKRVIDNNTIIVNEYGTEHAIKFAGIRVSESNSTLYAPTVKEKKKKNKKTGRMNTVRTGKTMNEAAGDEISRYLKPGARITIQYDANEANKYSKDSTQSIRAVIKSKGVNVNRRLLNKGLAKEKENDDSPAAIHARYSNGDIAFGSIMETLTHGASYIPFIGDKFFQIRSPYEQYRKREVYNKDFKSWNHPIRDYLIPTIEESSSQHPIAGVVLGAFIGSMFGKNPYGKFMGSIIGGSLPAVGQIIHAVGSTEDREWIPKRRRQQDELNTYIDTLKYVKNMRLYNQYKDLAKKKDKFDVDKYLEEKSQKGEENKERQRELNNYKRLVKLDYKHRGNYNFKYGSPKYVTGDMDRVEIIKAINQELSEISSDRKVEKLPLNAIKAISYKQAAQKTMYGYEPGDDIRNIMAALPKKERQYYSKMVNAPEEERKKILRIAPSYLRRALQASWGMHVDEKPELQEYFTHHALPDQNWVGWQEDTSIEDVKVKIVNANGFDPGEFDIWNQNKIDADKVNIPVPKLNKRNDPNMVQVRLNRIMNMNGFNNVNVSYMQGINGDQTTFDIVEDPRDEVARQISQLQVG